jgi:hypothetical protein
VCHSHVLLTHVAPTWATTRATPRIPIRILFPWLRVKQNSSVDSLQLLLTITCNCHFTPHQTKLLFKVFTTVQHPPKIESRPSWINNTSSTDPKLAPPVRANGQQGSLISWSRSKAWKAFYQACATCFSETRTSKKKKGQRTWRSRV